MKLIFFCVSVFCLIGGSTSYCQDVLIKIVAKGYPDIGICSTIKQKNSKGLYKPISKTDEKGVIREQIACKPFYEMLVVPTTDDYFSKPIDCPVVSKIIYLTNIRYTKNLVANGNFLYTGGDAGSAALAFTDAAVRMRPYNPSESKSLEVQAYIATARALGVDVAIFNDEQQGKEVMSNQLKVAIVTEQEKRGLNVSGQLDFPFLQSISSRSLKSLKAAPPMK